MIRKAAVALLLALAVACAREQPNPYLSVTRSPAPGGVRLTLVPTPGTRINARLQPALELPDSTIHRFAGTGISPDSYYTAPPELTLPEVPRGIIRASVCGEHEAVCRLVTLALR